MLSSNEHALSTRTIVFVVAGWGRGGTAVCYIIEAASHSGLTPPKCHSTARATDCPIRLTSLRSRLDAKAV